MSQRGPGVGWRDGSEIFEKRFENIFADINLKKNCKTVLESLGHCTATIFVINARVVFNSKAHFKSNLKRKNK